MTREPGDKRIAKESTVVRHMRRLLNERDDRRTDDHKAGTWRRFYPDRVGLTGSRLGVWNGRQGDKSVMYWHERYAIEDAAQEFNKASHIYYMAA